MPNDALLRQHFLAWNFARAACHRGYWLVASLYLVTEAGLSGAELIAIGVAQSIVSFAAEIPTGVVADTISRKRSIVAFHVFAAPAMAITGTVTDFATLVATQMLWGFAWTFTSGAEVAWITDELDDARGIDRLLAAQARVQQWGAAAGMIGFGALAWVTGLGPAIVASGIGMAALGVWVAWRFPERRFTPTEGPRLAAARAILRDGLALARRDRTIRFVLAATLLVNGASEGFERLHAKQLIALGLPSPPAPIVWLTGLGLVALALGALALRIVERRIDRERAAPQLYAGAAGLAALGLVALALAPDARSALAAILVVNGIGWSVTRAVSTIWINRRASSDVRATVQSLLAQAEFVGEIGFGVLLGAIAFAGGVPAAMLGAAALAAAAGAAAWGTERRAA